MQVWIAVLQLFKKQETLFFLIFQCKDWLRWEKCVLVVIANFKGFYCILFISLCMCACTHVGHVAQLACGAKRTTCQSFLLLCGFHGCNSGRQAEDSVPLGGEPACQPLIASFNIC